MPAVQHPRVWLVLWCGPSVLRHRASCFSTQSCAPTITCSNTGCGAGSTCCVDGSTLQPFCAQGTNVTCCGSEQMTCEAGTICDPVGGPCVTPSPEPTEWCTDCQALVKFLEKKGCSDRRGVRRDFQPPRVPFDRTIWPVRLHRRQRLASLERVRDGGRLWNGLVPLWILQSYVLRAMVPHRRPTCALRTEKWRRRSCRWSTAVATTPPHWGLLGEGSRRGGTMSRMYALTVGATRRRPVAV